MSLVSLLSIFVRQHWRVTPCPTNISRQHRRRAHHSSRCAKTTHRSRRQSVSTQTIRSPLFETRSSRLLGENSCTLLLYGCPRPTVENALGRAAIGSLSRATQGVLRLLATLYCRNERIARFCSRNRLAQSRRPRSCNCGGVFGFSIGSG